MSAPDEHILTSANQAVSVELLEQSECCNVDINDLVVDLSPMITRLVGSEIQLQHDLDAGIGAVWGDARVLEQVIIDLVVNARGAMPDGGTISISTEKTADMRDAHRTPKGVRLTVSDSGHGIDAANRTHSSEGELSSLPVSTSLRATHVFVQMHNGVISINSEVGYGTDVSVELPFSSVANGHAAQATKTQAKNAKTILLAEDVYGVGSRVYSILTKAGYKVLNAHSGQHAIEILSTSKSKIDLCLFDAVMAEVNGSQAYDIIEQWESEIPVIFMADNSHQLVEEDSKLKYIFKPFSRANVLSQVGSCLGDVS